MQFHKLKKIKKIRIKKIFREPGFVGVVYMLYRLLPARASEQGNVIGLVSVYICTYVRSCHQKKIVIERTREQIYLKFVETDFFPKIISPSAGENSGDLA